jgi:pimeloyl-ACP methyl ester carboxylesterase
MQIIANNIAIEVEDTHPGDDTGRPPVLLIMGLGMQLVAWPPELIEALVSSGFRVVAFDNRDIGLSQYFDELGTPNLAWEAFKYRMGWRIKPPYSLHDMACDALGVLDALQIERAHVVGVSMGGMIAQRLALLAPERLLSLTSIMSSSGARGLPAADSRVTRVLLSRPKTASLQSQIDHTIALFKVIGSPVFPHDEALMRERVALYMTRSNHPQGFVRQIMAAVADETRAEALARVTTPTLVVHGRADLLVPFACGEDTARRIPGAQLHGIDGMGHDLAPGVIARLLDLLVPHFEARHTSKSVLLDAS